MSSLDIHRCQFVDFTPHSITALAFSKPLSKDGSGSDVRLAVGRSNGDIEIWNPRWVWVHELTLRGGRGRSVEGLVWAQGDDSEPARLFSIGGSTSITEWDLETSLPIANYQCDAGVIWSLAASPDGTRLAAGCDDGSVVILDISGGPSIIEFSRILQRQDARVLSLAWRGNDQIVGGLADARIRVWSTKAELRGKILGTMKVDQSKEQESTLVWSVQVLNHKLMISGDSTGSVKFWDLTRFSLLQTFKAHEADVLCLAADASGHNVFSAGVDRKIISYTMINKELGRWASNSSRLLHSHDIRAMAIHESNHSSFLVSGGVERSLVINDVRNFAEGSYRKLPITLQQPPFAAIPSRRLLMSYADQTIKIWKIGVSSNAGENKKLVCRMTLSADENITSAQLSSDGSLLAVSTIAETKLFNLTPSESGKALKVTKIPSHDLEEQGARLLKIINQANDKKLLLLVSPDSELTLCSLVRDESTQQYVVDVEQDPIELELAANKFKNSSKLNHLDSIHLVQVSDNGRYLGVARLSGAVDLFDLENLDASTTSKLIGKFSIVATALKFTSRNTIVIVTAEIKVVEYDLESLTLTSWSRQNSEILPRQLVELQDKCCGVFFDPENSQRMWLWGGTWLGFLDTSVNIPIQRIPKRRRNRLGISTEDETAQEEENTTANGNASTVNGSADVDESIEDEEETEIIARVEETRKKEKQRSDESSSNSAFWLTRKYRPILFADTFGPGEIVLIERPLAKIPLPPAFWSNHRITL